MSSQRLLIPSTSMLMAFDAAARTGSFTAAARELNLTQGAVSKQVCALETQLDVVLFQRIRKTVALTEPGKVYALEVNKALTIIRNASLNAMTCPLNGVLNLAILPTFGTRWLIPRLPSFLDQHPDITVNFVTKLSPFDFDSENIHAAIHYGSPDWRGAKSTYLMGEDVYPVCSRKFLNQHPLSTADKLAQSSLLHLSTRPKAWQNWFSLNSVESTPSQGMLFEQVSTIAQAAIAGLGAALLPKFLIQSELDRDELQVIFDIPLQSDSAYYLVTPLDKSEYAPIVAFRQWLMGVINH